MALRGPRWAWGRIEVNDQEAVSEVTSEHELDAVSEHHLFWCSCEGLQLTGTYE
jgi:hypothetical protein